ncbi:MAG: hypothetical protein ISS45_08060 [Candidatus Omnitrophica bacterium]|nr:hypothetical protein [Candidatus Omnitrophota bacterium]
MPGNEKAITKYLLQNKNKITLHHLGVVNSVGAPGCMKGQHIEMNAVSDVDRLLATQDSRKKADIYVNNHAISIKQTGSSFLYNRLQRANILKVFTLLGFSNPESMLQRLDKEVLDFHKGNLTRRNRPWQDFFNEAEFKALVKFLMLQGSPNVGFSSHPAEFVLEAPANNPSETNINVFTFDEYFEEYKNKIKIAIRRQWVGQASGSEHGRAVGLARKRENAPWVLNGAVGTPRSGWIRDFPASERKTVYFLMLEKER